MCVCVCGLFQGSCPFSQIKGFLGDIGWFGGTLTDKGGGVFRQVMGGLGFF